MFKKSIKNKIIVSVLAIFICGLIYFFPTQEEQKPKIQYTYSECNQEVIYLLDSNNYVARTSIIIKNTEIKSQIKEIIESLTINSNKKDYILNGFSALIPENTKILSLDLDDELIKVNFSKEFLNTSLANEEKIIEALIFSLLELDGFEKLMIFVEGEILENLPISNKKLPTILTKDFGINKVYNISTYKDLDTVTTYYLSKHKDLTYYVPITTVSNEITDKTEIIIKNLTSSPTYETNIMSYLSSETNLINYEINEETALMNFNTYIFSDIDKKHITEEVKYSIYYSLRDTLDVKEVIFNVDNEEIEKFTVDN